MFERFSEETREAVRRAQQEARAMSHGAVGTEHLALALTGVDDGVVADVFAKLGITAGAVRQEVCTRLGPGPDRAAGGHLPFSPLAKRALELSLRESLSCDDQNIRPEHLLLAVSGMSEGGGSEILRALGAGPDLIRTAVREHGRGPMMGRPIGSRPACVPGAPNPGMPPPVARADRLLQMFLTVAGRRAWMEQRMQFGLEDLLRVCAHDERAARPLSQLGIDVDLLRERLRPPPPAG